MELTKVNHQTSANANVVQCFKSYIVIQIEVKNPC